MIVNYVCEAIHMATVNRTKLVSCAVLIPGCSYRDLSSRITRIEEGLERPNIIQEPIMLMASSTTSDKFKDLFAEKVVGHILMIHCSRDGQLIPGLRTLSRFQKVMDANNKLSPELVKYLTDASICLVTVSKNPKFSVAPNVLPHYSIVAPPYNSRDVSEVTSPQQPITSPIVNPMNSPQTPHPIITPTQEQTEKDDSIIQDDPSIMADTSQDSDVDVE